MINWKQRWMQHSPENPLQTIVEIGGCCRVLIEYHFGVVEYHEDRIRVRVKYGCVCVTGRDMELRQMTKGQLVIYGTIDGVQLEREGE